MSKKSYFYLLDPLQGIPVDKPEDWLARIVLDYNRPRAAYSPGTAKKPYFKFEPEDDYTDLERVLKDIRSTKVASSLLEILDLSHEAYASRKHTFRSHKVERLRIEQDDVVLQQTLAYQDVMADIDRWDPGVFTPMYFVVGLLVSSDIKHQSTVAAGNKTKAGVDPGKAVGLAAAGGAAVTVAGDLVSAHIEGEKKQHEQKTSQTHTSGRKRVFAIEYRSFRTRLRQKPGRLGKLGGYGPQGDRSFGGAEGDKVEEDDDEVEAKYELDLEPFLDVMEIDGTEERCLVT